MSNFLVSVTDLPNDLGIEGLLGNNFLDQFKVEIDYQKESLLLQKEAA